MPTILNVQSSPNLYTSASRAVSKAFVDTYLSRHPGTNVIDLDLAVTPPPHFGPDHLRAFFTPPDTHEPASTAALAASDAYIDQVFGADVLVLATPIHNFGIASTMKCWIDHVVRAGKTFQFTETGPVGLVSDRKVIIAVGSGSYYSDGPYKGFEHAATYLSHILQYIGLTDITVLRAEGQNMGPEAAANGMSAGIAAAQQAAHP